MHFVAGADEGPYHRDTPYGRTDITEDRPGVPLHLGLRLLAASRSSLLRRPRRDLACRPRRSVLGLRAFYAQPGQVVTSQSVAGGLVAPGETFLRGAQRTDEQGMCAFRTICPGWYSSRTVHIHLRAHLGERIATTQLYFPDAVTDDVFKVAPYASRPQRDTTNATDSIFTEERGEEAVLDLVGSVAAGYIGGLCFAVGVGEE
jgi:hypothetical protein